MCERCCIEIKAKRGITVSCGPKIQSDGFVSWCKITVTVRDFFGVNSRKISVTCFGINTVIICSTVRMVCHRRVHALWVVGNGGSQSGTQSQKGRAVADSKLLLRNCETLERLGFQRV